jgi:hypothetical protein
MTTRAEYAISSTGGKWRVAKVKHRCDWIDGGLRCENRILPGDQYLDNGRLNPNSTNRYANYRICKDHADEKII